MIVERNLEDERCKMRMHEQGYTQSDMETFHRKEYEKEDLRRFFCRTGSLQGPMQTQTTLPRRRRRHREDRRTP